MTLPDFRLDRRLVRRRAARAATRYAGADFLAREIARRMAERLDYIHLAPSRILDLGCGPGADRPLLHARYPEAAYLGVRSIGPAVTREQSPAFLRNSNGRLDLPGPTQEAA